MSSKKTHNVGTQADPTAGNSPEQVANPAPEASDQSYADSSALAELESQLAEARAQAAEYKDGWQRSVAEFQNYRRRVEADKAEPTRLRLAASSNATCPFWMIWNAPCKRARPIWPGLMALN